MEPEEPTNHGLLDKHAPQVISTVTGLIIGLGAVYGYSLTEGQESILGYVVALLVPPLLAWLGGKITEGYTYARKTVDRLIAAGRDR